MKAIVHIGAPKTGSSSIQAFLDRNKDEFERRGFRYSRLFEQRGSQYEYVLAALHEAGQLPGNPENRRHFGVTTRAALEDQAKAPTEYLARYADTYSEPVALFSSEHFVPWLKDADTVKVADAMFGRTFEHVRYILYLRNPVSYLVSQYSETVKRGNTNRLSDFVKSGAASVKQLQLVERWVSAVGRERLDVRLMETDWMRDGDLLADYCHAVGADLQGMQTPRHQNTSLNVVAAEALRRLNRQFPELADVGKVDPFRARLFHRVVELAEGAPPLALSRPLQRRIEKSAEASTSALRAKYFPERKTLYTPAKFAKSGLGRREKEDWVSEILVTLIRENCELGSWKAPTAIRTDARRVYRAVRRRVRGIARV